MTPSVKPSATEEEDFMAKLLMDPPVTPTRHRGLSSHKPNPGKRHSGRKDTCTPKHQLHSVGQVDLEEEISGWDWDALSDYVPTPKKYCESPQKGIQSESGPEFLIPSVVPKYVPDPCTRCLVQTVTDTWNDGVREKVRILLCVHRSC